MTADRTTSTAYPLGLRAVGGRNARLKARLAGPEILVAPGCYDCLTARLAETGGFEAAYISGAGVSLSALGAPDVGLASFSEVLDRVRRIADVCSIPLVADIDTGFGGPLNVIRTIREFERAGISAVQLEDQEAPKKCGHELGRRIVSTEEMVGRIKAAVDARHDRDFQIIARTDARTSLGLNAALDRAAAYAEAGADVLFIESPESEAEMRTLCARFKGRVPVMANMVEGGRTPIIPAAKLQEIGYRFVIFPNSLTRAFAKLGADLMAELHRKGTTDAFADRMYDHKQLWSLFDYDTWLALEAGFGRLQRHSRNASQVGTKDEN
jgi:2-methylisocitrate lyase-like PEP mutase family enzyme